MKTRIKELILVKSMPVLALALLVLLGTALAAGRDPVYGSGTAKLDMSTGTATGEATLIIGGDEFTVSLEVQITSQILSDEGVLHATATHTFTLPSGTIITSDKEVINTTDGTLNAHLTITRGTGAFEGASGELTGHGQVQFPAPGEPPIADVCYELRGAISR